MSRCSPFVIELSEADRSELDRRVRCYTGAHARVVRARIVLLAAEGIARVEIARRLGVCVDIVSRWRKRFREEGLAGLEDRPRTGRPRVFAATVVAQVKAMACEAPAARDLPLSRWNSSELATQVVSEGLVEALAASTVRRWLSEYAIKPWRYRSWIFPRDPDFALKASRVLDLYQRVWQGTELGPDDYVVSADESPSSKPCPAVTRTCLALPVARPGSSSSTAGAAPWPTWAPTTCTGPS